MAGSMQVRTVGTPSGKSTGIFLDGTSNPSHACIDGQLESWKRSIGLFDEWNGGGLHCPHEVQILELSP